MSTKNCNDVVKRINTLLLLFIAGCLSAFSEVNYDLNDDGKVTWADYELLKVHLENPNQVFVAKYDLDANGVIDDLDANDLSEEIRRRSETTYTVNGVSFKMVAVEGGTFTMGATAEQGSDASDDEKPAHQVTLSSFSIGQTEVTQELWQAVMGSNPSRFTGNLQRPVEYVTWNQCQTFITKLNQLTGHNFRLPTEAEWEFAARGGNQSRGYKYSGSNTVGDVAWYWDNIPSQSSGTAGYGTQTVATKAPNELGLYDMSGNVWEWCQDWWGSYSSEAQTNPTGPATGSIRVHRGGSWYDNAWYCRVSEHHSNPSSYNYNLGLRLALYSEKQLATDISLDKTTASVVVDMTLKLTATVSPNNTTNKTVTWTSSNTSIATVNSNGLVTAKAVGTATITAKTDDGSNLSATCNVTVTPQLATGISLNQTQATIYDGTTLQLTATVSPNNTTNKTVTWTSSNTNIATVSENGLVTAKSPGTALITATTQDGSNLSATCRLTVQKQYASGIELNQNTLEIGVGASSTLTATISPENTTDKRVMWTSSNTSIASVAAGKVVGNSMGECIITATTLDGSNLSANCHVVVANGGGSHQGDNYLSAEDINDVVAGQAFIIPIAMTNEASITMLQADLYLPNNVILPNYNEDEEFVTLDDNRKGRGHNVSTTVTAVATRIVASSSRNDAFQGNDGTVMYIALRMADGVPSGTYGVDLKNIILTTPDGEMIEAPNVRINVGAVDYHSGDANGDGYVDDVDYAITVRYILAQSPINFVFGAADLSGDGRVLVNDLPLIIDAAMTYDFDSGSLAPRRVPAQASGYNKLYVNDFDLAGNQSKTLSIVLDNATAFSAVQCDICLPEGLSIVEQTDEWGDPAYALPVSSRINGHDSWTDLTGRGDVRMIIASSSNKALKCSSGAMATFKVRSAAGFSGEHELMLKNIVCADADAVRYALPDAVCKINHMASLPGDVDGNGEVNGTDLNILINIILGKDNADNYGGRANVNGDGTVDGNDLNTLINIILGK